MNDKLLSGKVGLIFGVASHRSIAAGIATSWASQGADLVLNYQDERIHNNVSRLAKELRSKFGVKVLLLPCDVTDDEQISQFFASVQEHFDHVDLLLHSLAYAPREALDEGFTKTSRADFNTALNVSVYSLVALTRGALPLMSPGSSVLAMTFLGSQKVIPHYNVMGVAKASLESSVQYLAADLWGHAVFVSTLLALARCKHYQRAASQTFPPCTNSIRSIHRCNVIARWKKLAPVRYSWLPMQRALLLVK